MSKPLRIVPRNEPAMTEEAGADPNTAGASSVAQLARPRSRIGKDGVAFSKSPESVFLAYRCSGVQVEAYDPRPGRPAIW